MKKRIQKFSKKLRLIYSHWVQKQQRQQLEEATRLLNSPIGRFQFIMSHDGEYAVFTMGRKIVHGKLLCQKYRHFDYICYDGYSRDKPPITQSFSYRKYLKFFHSTITP